MSRSRWEGGARQRSRPGRIRAIAAITRPDSDQRTSDRVAGPKSSTSARPVTGLRAKQAGTRASSRSFIGQARPGARFAPSAGENGGFGEPCRRILCTAPPAKGGAHVVAGLRKRHLDRRASPERRGAAARGCTRKRDCNGQRQRQERARAERDTSVGAAARHTHGGARSSRCGTPGRCRCRRVRPPHEGAGAAHRQPGRGRLVFAMDATMSRQPTWDMALALQADMFQAVKAVGGLDVQLVYFRGAGECRASRWVSDPDALAALMTRVTCAGGLHADPQGARPTRARRRPRSRSTRWSTSATAWRRMSTICAGAPASWRCWACRCSCSRKAATRAPRRPSARSPGSPRAPTAASMRARRRSCASCCRRSRSMPRAGARRWRRSPGAARAPLLQQLK